MEKIVTLLEVFQASDYYEKEDIRVVGIGAIREGEWTFGLLVSGGILILKMLFGALYRKRFNFDGQKWRVP